ncbi:MAG TPA: VOC family protein [Solirubrobacterales bacterium]|nr:VOC family protein [Solirubrobacterales bacterium]
MRPGAISLNVADLDRQRAFYEETIGLRELDSSDGAVRLGAAGTPVVELVEARSASPRPPRTSGLFHLAVLVPSRRDLAASLCRAARSGWSFVGAADHFVSEALYLDDPEGNGIEIYRDRPREEWRYRDGAPEIATLPLDVQGLAGELREGDAREDGVPDGTKLGHVHLNVGDLGDAGAFYHGMLGLDKVREYPGVLFLSSSGYHHHLGLNTWAGEGAPPPPEGALGLRRFELVVDGEEELDEIERRLRQGGAEVERDGRGLELADPSGNRVLLRAGRPPVASG